ncbi:MAG: hypothetical protein ACE5LG_05950 [Anaerolineae bacterium]
MDVRRGIIRAFDSDTYLADVQIVGSMATVLTGVPVAKQIGADLLTSGTKCGVLFFDETNPSDACVAFVYEGLPGRWVTPAMLEDTEEVGFGQNIVRNGNFESWSAGTSSAPDEWFVSGTGASVARDADEKIGTYAAQLTYGSATAFLLQDMPAGEWEHLKGHIVTLCAWVKTSTAGIASIIINDGVEQTTSATHDGDGTYQLITVTRTIDSGATRIRVGLRLGGSGNALVDGMILVEGDLEQAFVPHYEDHHLPDGGVSPCAHVYRSTDQSIPHATWTEISWDNERFDTDDIWASSPNPTRLTCKTAGKYLIITHGAFYANGTGDRYVQVRVNGTTLIVTNSGPGSASGGRPWGWNLSTLYDLNVNDYVEVRVWQGSGAALSIRSSGDWSPEFMMVKVAY